MKINDGLILPFRFYDDVNKQMRYRGCGRYETGDEIIHNEYLITVGCRLLPFQIRRATDPSTTTNLSVVNITTDVETDLTSYVDSSDWGIETVGEYDYITYFGSSEILDGGNCVFDNCIYYAKFNDGTNTWYSELFRVADVDAEVDNDYRIWSTDRGALRKWEDSDDIRITR